jgi:hypothetical protein
MHILAGVLVWKPNRCSRPHESCHVSRLAGEAEGRRFEPVIGLKPPNLI